MRIIFGALLIIGAVTAVLKAEAIFWAGIENNFSWTLSKAAPWLIVLLASLIAVILIRSVFSRKLWRNVFSICLPIVMLAFMFAMNPIYSGDYIRKGDALNIKSHVLIDIVENYKSDFNGLVAVVDYNCPFCREATKEKLRRMQDRNLNIDLALTLNTSDQTTIENYIKETDSESLKYLSHESSAELLNLTKGVFPTYFYIKNGQILHKWKNSQLGYTALDWIENGLK